MAASSVPTWAIMMNSETNVLAPTATIVASAADSWASFPIAEMPLHHRLYRFCVAHSGVDLPMSARGQSFMALTERLQMPRRLWTARPRDPEAARPFEVMDDGPSLVENDSHGNIDANSLGSHARNATVTSMQAQAVEKGVEDYPQRDDLAMFDPSTRRRGVSARDRSGDLNPAGPRKCTSKPCARSARRRNGWWGTPP